MFWGPLSVSLAPQIKSIPSLFNFVKPLANFYAKASGHRALGLRYDDLIIEETEDVQKAISRLSTREGYDRAWRIRTAINQSSLHKNLPKDQWTKPEEDVQYLTPLVKDVLAEGEERAYYDNAAIEKRK